MMTKSNFNFFNCNFINNTGTSINSTVVQGAKGGCIYLIEQSSMNAKNCNFSNNLLYQFGVSSPHLQSLSGMAIYIQLVFLIIVIFITTVRIQKQIQKNVQLLVVVLFIMMNLLEELKTLFFIIILLQF